MVPALRARFRWIASLAVLVALALSLTSAAQTAPKPKVRAITAFVSIDSARHQQQIADALVLLHRASKAYADAGYEVETIRIATQPFPEYTRGMSHDQAMNLFRGFSEIAQKENVIFAIGPAMMKDQDDPANAELLGEVLVATRSLNATLVIADDDGIHWNGIRAAAKLLKYVEEHSPHSQAAFGFTAAAMVPPYAPFFPASYHLGAGHQFAVGLESANIVDAVFGSTGYNPEAASRKLAAALGEQARTVAAIGEKVGEQTGWTYLGLDPTPAPLGDVSIGAAIEKFLGAKFGSSGTMTAASIITRAVKSVPVKQVGYAGLMVPVLEDARLAQRWGEGAYNLDSLLAYSAVCATGLDTVPLPGDITEQQIERIFGDVAALAFKWHKPLTARLLPVAGKKAGERSEFDDPRLANTRLQPLP